MIEFREAFSDDSTTDSIINSATKIDLDSTLGAVRASLGIIKPELVDLSMHNPLGVLTLSKERSPAKLQNLLSNLMQSALSLEQAVWNQVDDEGAISSKRRFSQLVTTFSHILYPPDLSNKKHGHFSVKTGRYPFSPEGVSRHGRKIENYNSQSAMDIVAQVYEQISSNTLMFDSFPNIYADYGERFSYLNGTMPGFAKQEMISNCRDGRRFDEISTALEHAKKDEIRPHLLIGLSDEYGECLSAMRCDLAKKERQLGLVVYNTDFPKIKTFVSLQNVPLVAGSAYLEEIGQDFEALNIKPGYRLKACHGKVDQINTGAFARNVRSF